MRTTAAIKETRSQNVTLATESATPSLKNLFQDCYVVQVPEFCPRKIAPIKELSNALLPGIRAWCRLFQSRNPIFSRPSYFDCDCTACSLKFVVTSYLKLPTSLDFLGCGLTTVVTSIQHIGRYLCTKFTQYLTTLYDD